MVQKARPQDQNRKRLWALLGDLPDFHMPVSSRMIAQRDFPCFLLEVWSLSLNGVEPVPAYFCKARNAPVKAPAIVYNHAHGGGWGIGKDELIAPREPLQRPPFAEVLAQRGIHSLAIDAWNFGERRGRTESELFKEMLWKGQVLWGMMVFDTIRATDWLVARDDVDAGRIGSMGLSMGSTMAWWHAALDERVRVCVDICCLTDYHALIKSRCLDGHGLYYYVPSLLKSFDTTSINALIAPRAHLALAGLFDPLTPVDGLDKIDEGLKQTYYDMGAAENWKLLRYPCGHMETTEMRAAIMDWLDSHL